MSPTSLSPFHLQENRVDTRKGRNAPVMGVFLDFDDTLWPKSSINTLCVPVGPIVDATIKLIVGVQAAFSSRRGAVFSSSIHYKHGFSSFLIVSFDKSDNNK